MSDKNVHINLLNKLIEGTISPEEKWNLERLSLDDPFLAEAIEGFYDNKYDKHKIKKLVFDMNRNKRIFLKPLILAASILLLLGVTYVFQLQNDKNQWNQQILMHDTDTNAPETEIVEQVIQEEELKAKDELKQIKRTSPEKIIKEKLSPKLKSNKAKNPTEKVSGRNSQDYQMKEKREESPVARHTIHTLEAKDGAEELAEVQTLEPINAGGIIVDELGNPLPGANIKSSSGKDATESGSDGRFKLRLKSPREYLITSFNGYQIDSTPASAEMSIELKRAESVFGQEHITLEELMSENDLVRLYREKLDKIFIGQFLKCPRQINRYEVKLKLTIDQKNQLAKLEFLQNLDEECKNEIQKTIEDAAFNRLFKGSKKVSFFYDIKR